MKISHGLSIGLCIGALSLAAPAGARVVAGLAGVPGGNPTATTDHVNTSGGSVINETGNPSRLGWTVPLSIETTTTKSITVVAAGDANPEFGIEATTCRGHRINPDGTIYASTVSVTWAGAGSASAARTLPNIAIDTHQFGLSQTVIVGCWIGQGGGHLDTVHYNP